MDIVLLNTTGYRCLTCFIITNAVFDDNEDQIVINAYKHWYVTNLINEYNYPTKIIDDNFSMKKIILQN